MEVSGPVIDAFDKMESDQDIKNGVSSNSDP